MLAALTDGCGAEERLVERELGVLLVDDDAMVRSWVRLSLEGSEFRLVGECGSADEAIELAQRRAPQLLLVDQRLPDRLGQELVRELRQQGVTAPALLMTAQVEQGFNEAARAAGAHGTVLKTGNAHELLAALRLVAAGSEAFDGRHPRRARGRAVLSPREREVLRLVAEGRTNKEIAAALSVGDETVKTLLARIFAKLDVKRRAEAVATAAREGLL